MAAELNTSLLKELRKRLGYTQKQLADELGVGVRVYQTWEQGITDPRSGDLKLLSTVLEVTVDDLLGHERDEPYSLLDSVAERASELTDPEKYDVIRYIDFLIQRRGK